MNYESFGILISSKHDPESTCVPALGPAMIKPHILLGHSNINLDHSHRPTLLVSVAVDEITTGLVCRESMYNSMSGQGGTTLFAFVVCTCPGYQ